MSVLPSPIPHPLDALPWDVPGWVYEGLEWVLGVQWPEGDEKAVWDLADQWYSMASVLTGPRDDAAAAVTEVLDGYGGVGAVAHAFEAAWRGLVDGEHAPLTLLLSVGQEMGELVESCGTDIEAAKIEVWIEVGLLVVELLSLAVGVALTAGAASPAAAAAMTASRLAIQKIFQRLLTKIASKALRKGVRELAERTAKAASRKGLKGFAARAGLEGVEEAGEEVGVDLATQAYQNTTGRRDGLDMRSMGMSALGGLAGGAGASVAGIGRHFTGRGAHFAEGVAREMGGEVIAENAASLATGQGFVGLTDAARAATSGVTGGTLGQTHHLVSADLPGKLDAALAGLPPAMPDLSVLDPGGPPLTTRPRTVTGVEVAAGSQPGGPVEPPADHRSSTFSPGEAPGSSSASPSGGMAADHGAVHAPSPANLDSATEATTRDGATGRPEPHPGTGPVDLAALAGNDPAQVRADAMPGEAQTGDAQTRLVVGSGPADLGSPTVPGPAHAGSSGSTPVGHLPTGPVVASSDLPPAATNSAAAPSVNLPPPAQSVGPTSVGPAVGGPVSAAAPAGFGPVTIAHGPSTTVGATPGQAASWPSATPTPEVPVATVGTRNSTAHSGSPGSDYFSKNAPRTNADVLENGAGTPFTPENVTAVASRMGIDLSGVEVILVTDPEEIRYLDFMDACAYTPSELNGQQMRLGPATFSDEETLAATVAHEYIHVLQQWAGEHLTRGLKELEDEAYAGEAPALARFRGER